MRACYIQDGLVCIVNEWIRLILDESRGQRAQALSGNPSPGL